MDPIVKYRYRFFMRKNKDKKYSKKENVLSNMVL